MTLTVTLQTRPDYIPPSSLAAGYVSKHWWPELRLDLNLEGIAADFYLFYAMKDASPYLKERFEEYSQVVAKQIAVYMDAAIGGELRHKAFHGLKKGSGDARGIARRDWRRMRQAEGRDLLEAGRNCFYNTSWAGPFGGKKWGDIADLLVRHLAGETDCHLFIDLALALQHNTGSVFNKLAAYWSQHGLKTVLDANLYENWEGLLPYASDWARTMFLTWLTEEEDVVVEGIAHSRPRVVLQHTGGFSLGAKVQVRHTARAKEVRGLEGIIMKMPNDHSAHVMVNGVTKWMSIKNLLILESAEQVETREYIAEA